MPAFILSDALWQSLYSLISCQPFAATFLWIVFGKVLMLQKFKTHSGILLAVNGYLTIGVEKLDSQV